MSLSLTVLGSNSAIPTSKRYPSAHLLKANERFFLIDCGEGTQIQLRRFNIKFQRIERIFISHLHGDHFYGLIGLLSTMQLLGRIKELHIYAFPQLEEVIKLQLKVSGSYIDFPLIFVPLKANADEVIFEDNELTVETITLKHRISCNGFLFREKLGQRRLNKTLIEKYKIPVAQMKGIKEGNDLLRESGEMIRNELITLPPVKTQSFAYCSDTVYLERLIERLAGVDLLYHEATFLHEMLERAKATGHTTAKQAAELASLAKVGKLIIGHFSARYIDTSPFLAEASNYFDNAYLAEEGKEYHI